MRTKQPSKNEGLIFGKPINPGKDNVIEFELSGDYALFSDPISRVGGEKFSYPVPTYEALKNILEQCYWKPTIIWYIDECRVMNRIGQECMGVKPLKWDKPGNDLAYYTYLVAPRYQIRAHFEWNPNYPQLSQDRIVRKHYEMVKRAIQKGGRKEIFLGTRECMGYVKPCEFGTEAGDYDDSREIHFGLMFHGYTYPNEAYSKETAGWITGNFFRPVLRNGVITFPRPEDCPVHKQIREYPFHNFENKKEVSA